MKNNKHEIRAEKAGKIRFSYIATMTGLYTLVSCLTILFRSLIRRLKISEFDGIMNWWAKKLLRLARLNYSVIGANNFPEAGRRVIVMCNHSSLYDIPVIIAALNTSFRFVAKKELFKIPIFGPALSRGGFISIDRQNREQAIKDLQRAKEQMLKGITLWVSPEGTRSKDGKLAEFKRGGFHVAMESKALIVPVVIKNIHKVQSGDRLEVHLDQTVEVEICEAVDTTLYSVESRRALINDVRQKMLSALEQ